jgi:hypothetical protein
VDKRSLQKLFDDVVLENLQNYKEEEDRLKALENAHDLITFQSNQIIFILSDFMLAQYKMIRTFLARLIDQFETYNLKLQVQMNERNEEEIKKADIIVNLGERIIATESILFVYNHLKLIQTKLPVTVMCAT